MKIGIYCRVSTINQVEKSSLTTQKKMGIEFCERKGFKYEVFNDVISGTKINRIELGKLVEKLYNKELEGIWLYNWDRLQREKRVSIYFEDILQDTKCKLFVDNIERDIINSESDRMDYEFRGVMNNLELRNIRRRMSVGLKHKLSKDEVFLGVIPVGYKKVNGKLVVDEIEGKLIEDCFKMYLFKGVDNYRDLIRKLKLKYNDLDNRINEKSLSRILNDEKYKGIYYQEYDGENFELNIGRIVGDEIFDEVNKKIEYNKGKRKGNTKRDYLFKGMVYCGSCLNKMWIRGIENYRYYYCKEKDKRERQNFDDRFEKLYSGGCNCINENKIETNRFEKVCWDLLFEVLSNNKKVREKYYKKYDKKVEDKNEFGGKLKYYSQQIENEEKKRLDILNLLLEGKIDVSEKDLMNKDLDIRIEKIKEKKIGVEKEFNRLEKSEEILNYVDNFRIDLNNKYNLKRFEDKKRFVDKYIKGIEVIYDGKNEEKRKKYLFNLHLNIFDFDFIKKDENDYINDFNNRLDGNNEFKVYTSNLKSMYFYDLIYKNVFNIKFSLSLIEDKNRVLSINNINDLVIDIG